MEKVSAKYTCEYISLLHTDRSQLLYHLSLAMLLIQYLFAIKMILENSDNYKYAYRMANKDLWL